jgi:hypothetical protein
MDLRTLRLLIALRYRLLWAHVRTRNGRIVLLTVAYFAGACLAIAFALGGLSAAAAAVRLGRGEVVADVILAGLFVNALLGAVVLGIGVNPAFSDATLRRYPISRLGRMVARHTTALLEPLWGLVLTLGTGLALGFSVFGLVPVWSALPAAGLFVIATYLAASVIASLRTWVQSIPGGALLVIAAGSMLIVALPLAPAALARLSIRSGTVPGLALLGYTPPFAAATAIASSTYSAELLALLLLAGWVVVLWMLLLIVERLPRYTSRAARTPEAWSNPCDRIADLFGPQSAPLVGKQLRYYMRGPLRYNYLFVLPVVAMFASHRSSPPEIFLFVLGASPAVGFASTIPISMNLFGFDSHGIRRYFLLPIPMGHVFQTTAVVGLLSGAVLIPVGIAAWLIFMHGHNDGRMVAMLLSAALTGLLFFGSLGLWTTLLWPRAIPFEVKFGNSLSLAANLVMFVTLGALFGLPWVLIAIGIETVVRWWWVWPLSVAPAAAVYLVTLRVGSSVFSARRERMIELIEQGA